MKRTLGAIHPVSQTQCESLPLRIDFPGLLIEGEGVMHRDIHAKILGRPAALALVSWYLRSGVRQPPRRKFDHAKVTMPGASPAPHQGATCREKKLIPVHVSDLEVKMPLKNSAFATTWQQAPERFWMTFRWAMKDNDKLSHYVVGSLRNCHQ